jgi:uncharacterized Zn finger protein
MAKRCGSKGKLVAKNSSPAIPETTWEEIHKWAGSSIAWRGERYFNKRAVNNIQLLENGVVGTVLGGEAYTTILRFGASIRDTVAQCSCPYGGICKHAVALLLTVNALKKACHDFPTFDGDESRILFPRSTSYGYETDDHPISRRNAQLSSIREHLEKQSKAGLVSLLIEIAQGYPEVSQVLSDQANLKGGNIDKFMEALKDEMDAVMSEPAWWNGWKNEGHKADFSRVFDGMQQLHTLGNHHEVIDLADKLLEDGINYIESSNDEGDSAMEIARCLEVAFHSLEEIDWPSHRKLLWATDALLLDQYGICEAAKAVLEAVTDKHAWSSLADALLEKLSNTVMPETKKGERDFSSCYRRDRISEHLVNAFRHSERQEEILPLYEREVKLTGCWTKLVEELISLDRPDDAFKKAERGIIDLADTLPGVVNTLEDYLVRISEQRNDLQYICRLRKRQFTDHPSLAAFHQLRDIATKMRDWETARSWAISYLETGKQRQDRVSIQRDRPGKRHHRFPQYDLLIDIAIEEKDSKRVLKLYDERSKEYKFYGPDTKVAHAIEESFPDRAIDIWRRLAETAIAQANPKGYESGVSYLQHVKRVMLMQGRRAEWNSYMQELQLTHKRRPRFLSELRRIAGGKIS